MAMNLIQNVLGFTMILFVVSACSSIPEPIEISAKPVDKPILVLPQADALQSRDVEWIIITESNLDEQIKNYKTAKNPLCSLH